MTVHETEQLTEARKDIEYMQKDITEIKQTLDDLPKKLVEQLDERYASKEKVEEIEETVAPITKFRRNIWGWLVLIVFSFGLAQYLIVEYFKNNLK